MGQRVRYLRIGEVATALGVSVDTLRRWEGQGRIEFERRGNQRVLSAERLSQVKASLASAQGGATSADNELTGVVVAVRKDAMLARVVIASGDHQVAALMSREAADHLGLVPGAAATAVFSAMNVTVQAG